MTEEYPGGSSAPRARTGRRGFGRVVLALLGCAGLAAVVMSWRPAPIAVEIAPVSIGPLRVTIDEDGRTRVKDRYVVSAPLTGNLARVERRAGDAVTAGEVVARLLPVAAPLLDARERAVAEARLAVAEAAARQAEAAESQAAVHVELAGREAARFRDLMRHESVAAQTLERAEFELRARRAELASAGFGVRVARHEVQLAQAALSRLSGITDAGEQLALTSPVAGVILEVLRDDQGVVQAGAPILEVGDPRALEIVVDILTTDAVRVSRGANARIRRWGGESELAAKVLQVEPKAFTKVSSLGVEEQRVNVLLELEGDPQTWSRLGDGFRIEASIVVWEEAQVRKAPVSAVFRRRERWAVLAVEGEVARFRHVEIGQRSGFEVQILDGLAPGDRVILHPGERVTEGARVRQR